MKIVILNHVIDAVNVLDIKESDTEGYDSITDYLQDIWGYNPDEIDFMISDAKRIPVYNNDENYPDNYL